MKKKPKQVIFGQMSQCFLMHAGITNIETLLIAETHQLVGSFQQVQAKTEEPPTKKKKKILNRARTCTQIHNRGDGDTHG